MRHILMLAAALSLSAAGASIGNAKEHPGPYKADKNGACHSADGTFAKKDLCTGGGAMTKAAVDPNAPYKLDAKGMCHNVKGKMAKKEMCKA